MRYIFLIGLLGIIFYSPAQVITVITTFHDGSRDTIKFGFVQNATIGEDDALGEENIFMVPVVGYEGRILQRDQDNFSCAMSDGQTSVYYMDNFDSKVNYRNASDTSLQNRLFETWYSDSNTDSIEMICDIPISSFLQTAYLHQDDCNSDPPAPIGILILPDDTVKQTKSELPFGLGVKQFVYVTRPEILLTSHDDNTFENKVLDLRIYPNPTYGIITIEGPDLNQLVEEKKLQLFDALGRDIDGFEIERNTIDISSIPSGIYFLKIDGQIEKIIKVSF